jgi:DNA-binding beta-propeller fold protein YncE
MSVDAGMQVLGRPIPVGLGPTALAFDGLRLWVANSDSATIQYIVLHPQD